jgi:Leucine-rich repeat (LRR) protein
MKIRRSFSFIFLTIILNLFSVNGFSQLTTTNTNSTSTLVKKNTLTIGLPETKNSSSFQTSFKSSVVSLSVITDSTFDYMSDALKNPEKVKIMKIYTITSQEILDFESSMDRFTNLECLFIHTDSLVNLPENIGSLKKLKQLWIGGSKMRHLPNSLNNLGNLELLDVSNNLWLKTFPDDLSGLSKLKIVRSEGCSLMEFPKSICHLAALEVLDLSRNPINKIPAEIANLKKLYSLKIASANISILPDEILSMSSIKFLDLKFNKLTNLPDSIHKLINLETLNLYANPFIELPASIAYCLRLKTIFLTKPEQQDLKRSIKTIRKLNLNIVFHFVEDETKIPSKSGSDSYYGNGYVDNSAHKQAFESHQWAVRSQTSHPAFRP